MYIFDLDGTLAETRENRSLPPQKIIKANFKLFQEICVNNKVVIVSGRDEKQREMIEEFFVSNGDKWIPSIILNDLPYPKPPNHEYKRIVFKRLLDEWRTIDGVFDDNPMVANVCRDLGIPFYLVFM